MTYAHCEICGAVLAQAQQSGTHLCFLLLDQIDLTRGVGQSWRCSQHSLEAPLSADDVLADAIAILRNRTHG